MASEDMAKEWPGCLKSQSRQSLEETTEMDSKNGLNNE